MKNFPAGIVAFFCALFCIGLSFPMIKLVQKAGTQSTFYWVFIAIGAALIILSRGRKPGLDAWLGGVAGVFLWTAIGELGGLDEYYLDPGVMGLTLLVTVYLFLRPGTQCDAHQAVQKLFGLQKETPGAHWHGPNVGLAVFMTVWLGHAVEELAYYELGQYSWLTWTLLILSLVSAPFLFTLLWKTRDWGKAWGRGFPSVVIIWIALDILMKWKVIGKPW